MGVDPVSAGTEQTTTILCDDRACTEAVYLPGNATQARRLAREMGWRRRRLYPTGGLWDLCPRHSGEPARRDG